MLFGVGESPESRSVAVLPDKGREEPLFLSDSFSPVFFGTFCCYKGVLASGPTYLILAILGTKSVEGRVAGLQWPQQ